MKKAARSLSVAVLAIAAVAAVVATGWFVHAQDPLPPPGGDAVTIEEKEAQAASLAAGGQHAAAAALYEEIALLSRDTLDGQRRAVEAGINYGLAGQADKAISQFDFALSMAVRSRWQEGPLPGPAVWREAALYEKAVACEQLGCTTEALEAIEHLRLWYPYSNNLSRSLEIKARIESMPPSQLETLRTREQEALAILAEANALLVTNRMSLCPEALRLIERIETLYPETTTAVAAKVAKGGILNSLKEGDRAYEVLLPVVTRYTGAPFGTEIAEKAKNYLCESLLISAESTILRERRGQVMSTDAWNTVQSLCERASALGPSYRQDLCIKILRVDAELARRDPVKAETLADEYIQQYTDITKVANPAAVMVLYLRAADAARLNKKFEKALMLCEKVKTMYTQLPEGQFARPCGARTAYLNAYYKCFLTLQWANADRAELQAAGEQVIARFPDSHCAKVVRRHLGIPAE